MCGDGVGLCLRCRLSLLAGEFFQPGAFLGLLGLEHASDRLVAQALFLNRSELFDLLEGGVAQLRVCDPQLFDFGLPGGEFCLGLDELFLGDVELVEGVVAGVRQHVDEDLGLYLILRCLKARQERDPRGAAVHESGERNPFDVLAQLIDRSLQLFGFQLQRREVVLQLFEVGFGQEEGLGGGIRPVACVLDLARRALGRIIAGLCPSGDRHGSPDHQRRNGQHDPAEPRASAQGNRPRSRVHRRETHDQRSVPDIAVSLQPPPPGLMVR